MKLSILIPTIVGRENQFNSLYESIDSQITDEVEIITLCDNKELSIGSKRDILYNKAKGLYSVQIDDNDSISLDYVKIILEAIKSGADCVGYYERCTIEGKIKRSKISLYNECWVSLKEPIKGIDYLRTPFFKVPIKTRICQAVGVSDMRYNEDEDFSIRIKKHLRTEIFVPFDMYYYTGFGLTKEQINTRYGVI